jgi:hypothetical protein
VFVVLSGDSRKSFAGSMLGYCVAYRADDFVQSKRRRDHQTPAYADVEQKKDVQALLLCVDSRHSTNNR